MLEKRIEIYTDGSCIDNPGPGGWAVIILHDGKEIKLSGGESHTTNNRMEMRAIIEALKWARNKKIEKQIIFHCDSNLIIQTINKNWKKKANVDLWNEIDVLRGWLDIKWEWLKAHAKSKYNNLVDVMAFNEAQKRKI